MSCYRRLDLPAGDFPGLMAQVGGAEYDSRSKADLGDPRSASFERSVIKWCRGSDR